MEVSQYLNIFIDESQEHLQNLNEHLLTLEVEPDNAETINEIFRAAHSIKGMSATMGFMKMQSLTHDMENVLQEIRNGEMKVTSELVDVLFKGLDALELYLANVQETESEGDEDCQDIIDELNEIFNKAMGIEKIEKEDDLRQEINFNVPNELMKFKDLEIADHEKTAIVRAGMMGLNVIGLTIFIQETCILKGARAFMINRGLEDLGDIIKLHPTAQDLEDENYDLFYSAFIITEESPEKIKEVIMGISEVREVVADYIKLPEKEIAEYKSILNQDGSTAEIRDNEKSESKSNAKTPTKKKSGKVVASRSVRVDIGKLDELMNLVSELIIAKNSITSISGGIEILKDTPDYVEQIEYLERLTSNLHESVMNVRMVPIESVVNRFPRMIRDLSKQLDKDIELYMTGEETELDRTVIDEIGDPLMHLLRNAADHGLESTQDRINKNKNSKGSIFLDAFQEGNTVIIEVKDDGAGIDVEKIKNKAVEKGTISQEEADVMTDKEIIGILFRPSFSTSEEITDVSGRGVGLDVVRTKIESLGGSLEATTALGEGSVFRVSLPLTLAIVQVLMVRLNEEKYALPLASIQTVEDIPIEEVKLIEGNEVINLRGSIIPIIRLGELLGVDASEETPESLMIVIIKKGDQRAGLVIDDLLGQQEIVIKSIGKYIHSHKTISGSTILGNGEVALILDVNSLI